MGISIDNIESSILGGFKHSDLKTGAFRTRIFRVSELIAMLKSKKLQFIGGRPFKSWSRSHKSRFIESLLLGLPSDPIIIDGADSPWYIADGAEALSTIYEFIQGQFNLNSVNFNFGSYENAKFADLSLMMQGRLLNLQITATITTSDTTLLNRLGVYSSALLKIGKENDLWECAEVIFRNSIQKLKEMALQVKTDNTHLLLQIINAIIFSDYYKSGCFEDIAYIGEIRYNMFECLLLGPIDTLYNNIRVHVEHNCNRIHDIITFIEENKKNISKNQGKKLILFVITISLLSLHKKGYKKDDLASRFNEAWTIYKRVGKGDLNKDYAKKASVIYKHLCK